MMLGIGLLAAATTLTFADRTELRGRDSSGNAAGTDQSLDLETDPDLRLKVRGNHDDDEFSISYTPRLILSHFAYDVCGPSTATASCGDLPNIGSSYVTTPTPEIINGGGLSYKHQHGRTAVSIIEQGTYGSLEAGALLNEPLWTGVEFPPPIFPIPKYPDIQLQLVTSFGGLYLYEQINPRLDFQLGASFGVYGGPNNASRATFPLTESPGLQLKLEYALTRTDDLIASVGSDYVAVKSYVGLEPGFANTPGAPQDVAPASPQFSVRGYGEVRVRHHWARDAFSELAVGGVGAYQAEQLDTNSPVVTNLATPYPTAELITAVGTPAAAPQNDTHRQLTFIARVQPWLDIFDGTVVQRAEGIVAEQETFGLNTLRGEVVGHYVIPTDSSPGRYRFLYGEVDYARQVGRVFVFDVGLRGGAENTGEATTCTGDACPSTLAIPSAPSQNIYEGEAFVGFTWKPLPVKL